MGHDPLAKPVENPQSEDPRDNASRTESDHGAEGFLARGEEACGRGAWVEARAFFEKARDLDPWGWKPLQGIGIALFWLGKRDDAWKHLVEALRRAPDEPDNVANVLDVARSLGREAEAEAILAELRRSLPAPTAASPAEPFCVKGEEMLGAELWREAVQPFLQAIDSDPERSRAWSGLGIACFRDGKAKAATAFFEIALRLDPTDQDAVLNWAEACGRPGDDLESFLVSAGVSPDLAARARAEVSG